MKEYKAVRPTQKGEIIIGKPMMGALHIHKSAVNHLSEELSTFLKNKMQYLDPSFEYDIIKIDMKNDEIAFTQSSDWNTANEPEVGARVTIKGDTAAYRKPSTFIYHHKWMFVDDNYNGFDVTEAKARSEYWENHPHVVALIEDPNEKFFFKIGQKKYWNEVVCSVIGK